MKSSPHRRYARSVLLLMIAYGLILVGVSSYFENGPPSGLLAYAAAILPALPIIGVIAAIARLLVELKDEYLRMLMVRQTLFATGFMLAVATVWGFIESFGLLPHVPAYWAAILWFAGLGVGGCLNAILERRGREA